MSSERCVCGCDCEHTAHCCHGCTLVQADNGIDQGGPLMVRHTDYDGFYANRRYSL